MKPAATRPGQMLSVPAASLKRWCLGSRKATSATPFWARLSPTDSWMPRTTEPGTSLHAGLGLRV